ncbi:MAG TPA: AAA family ATPase [Gammaproteobacteria bacterium]|nr:AAA family ATPase [Gammaproteobacteria bacterium]
MKNDLKDLQLVLDARVRLIVIESWDELRVLETLTSLAVQRGMNLRVWSISEGLQGMAFGGEMQEGSNVPERALRLVKADPQAGLYVFFDLHSFLEDDALLTRLVKDIAIATGPQKPTLILVSHALKLPAEVQRFAARFSLSLPSEDELLAIVREEAVRWSEANRGLRVRTDNRTLQQVVKNLRGLSHADARLLARSLICDDGAITQEDLPELNKAKFQLLDLDGVLGYEADTARFADVGGLHNLKQWLSERQAAFMAGTANDLPKGMLLLGAQGSGKSLAAKAVAGLWGLPLLRLDFASLYNKYFGETERNLREALLMAERMSPCVLWMDEIEKGLATGDLDNGVSQRVLGTLLTWMAERKTPVFVVATANVIKRLPPELMRKGRFDEIFFVDLPAPAVREDIFRIHLDKRELNATDYDLSALALVSAGFSGAEIEQAVVSALYAAQARQVPIDQQLIIETLQRTVPLSVVMAEDLAALRHWAAERTVHAG